MKAKSVKAKRLASRARGGAAVACVGFGMLALSAQPAAAQSAPAANAPAENAQAATPITDAQRQHMEQELQQLLDMRGGFDQRIRALEVELHGKAEPSALPAAAAGAAPAIETIPAEQVQAGPPTKWGGYEPGKGLVLMRSDLGEVDVGLVSYLRYLNQGGQAATYTDAFGRQSTIDRRQDFQLAKVQVTFRGWLFSPQFGYNAYVWTSQTSQGQSAQVVVAGNLNYTFNDALQVFLGVQSVPSTRSTNRTFPFWLRNDNRPIADEFFRGSYTQGIWAQGKIMSGLEYRVMIANNLSALGVSAAQLDPKINTVSGALTWMPSTGEFGPGNGNGDFEEHQKVATLFSAHYTRSTETPQSQPNTESIENTQLRLSDGTLLFAVDAFNTPGRITEALYQLVALDGAVKYHGYSLEFVYFSSWLDHFKTEGIVPVTQVYDDGFTLQASAMPIPKTPQVYFSGSEIFGRYGDPYDAAVGINWFPFHRRDLRLNMMGLYTYHSPVGYTAYPVAVGATGFTFLTDFSLAF